MNVKKYIMNNYLKTFTKNTDNYQTHLSLIGGKYNVPDEMYETFYDTYYNELTNNTKMYLVEKIKDSHFAFFVDIDGDDTTSDDTKTIINSIKKVLSEYAESDAANVNQYIVSRSENKYHINFYNLIVDTNIASTLIKLVKKDLNNEKYNKIIDTSVYKTGLRLLGSFKKEGTTCYKLYDLENNEYIELSNENFKKCIIRRKNDCTLSKFKNTFSSMITSPVAKTTVAKTKVSTIVNPILEHDIFNILKYIKKSNNQQLKHYSFEKNTIYSINASLNVNGVFCYYISITDKYCPFKCREHIRKSSPIYIEISIKGIFIKCYDVECLKMTYPECGFKLPDDIQSEYNELYRSMTDKYWNVNFEITPQIRKYLEDSLSGTHYQISKAMFNIYKDKFRVDDIKNSEWFIYNDVRWEKTYRLNIMISEELPRYYKGMKVKNESGMTEEQAEENVRNQQIDNIIQKLENVIFKENIIKQLTYMFKNHDKDFKKYLDENPYLLGFNNGIYDFKTCEFRKGKIDDFITYSTGYDYIDYNEDNEYIQEIYTFLSQIITNESVREYLLKVLGKSLLGIPDEKFFIFTGISGANGKSTLISFLEMCLNDYMISADISLLTNKRNNSGNASPDVLRMKGVRMIAFQEPENNDKLHTGMLKQLSGNDSIIARGLFKDPVSFKMQGTMFLCCNDLPSITSTDGGTWRRIRVIDFNSKFCDNPDPNKPNEFPIDKTLKEKMKKWKPYFMSILIHYYKIYKKEGLTEPEEVLIATNRYKTDNDKFNEFFDNNIVEDSNNIENFKDIYSQMSYWWSTNYSNIKTPDVRELKRSLKTKYGLEKEKLVDGMIKYGFNIRFINNQTNTNNIIDDDY
jgi:P4 family phage/plasmid primase-like protien